MAHLNWWIRIVGAHGVRPISTAGTHFNSKIYSTILAVRSRPDINSGYIAFSPNKLDQDTIVSCPYRINYS